MRVIAGLVKGRPLKAVPGRNTRPTADRVKESVFGIIGGRILVDAVLDLFAGTGNLGIEALSRGAGRAVFVEKDRRALETLSQNLASTGFAAAQGQASVAALDVLRFLTDGRCRRVEWTGPFGLVFADPPYGLGLAERTLSALRGFPGLAPGALVVVEHAAHDILAEAYGALDVVRREKYGETIVSFYRMLEVEPVEDSGLSGEL